jgi:hypothetical protein
MSVISAEDANRSMLKHAKMSKTDLQVLNSMNFSEIMKGFTLSARDCDKY